MWDTQHKTNMLTMMRTMSVMTNDEDDNTNNNNTSASLAEEEEESDCMSM